MITVSLDPNSLREFKKDLKQLKDTIDSQDLNMYRAKKYREHTVDMVRSGTLNLRARTGLTEYLMGNYDPLSVTGKLLEQMKVMPGAKKSGEAGYFGGGPEVPSIGYRKLSYTDLAILQHTGYRIPLQGPKGKKVRAWFVACYGIHFKKEREWLIVPPRPFMHRSLDSYERRGLDNKAVSEYIDKKLKGVFV